MSDDYRKDALELMDRALCGPIGAPTELEVFGCVLRLTPPAVFKTGEKFHLTVLRGDNHIAWEVDLADDVAMNRMTGYTITTWKEKLLGTVERAIAWTHQIAIDDLARALERFS